MKFFKCENSYCISDSIALAEGSALWVLLAIIIIIIVAVNFIDIVALLVIIIANGSLIFLFDNDIIKGGSM